jgi:hypothetical protein
VLYMPTVILWRFKSASAYVAIIKHSNIVEI